MLMKNQHGFGVLEGLIVAVIVVVLAVGGWYVWSKNHKKTPTQSTTSTQQTDTVSSDDNTGAAPRSDITAARATILSECQARLRPDSNEKCTVTSDPDSIVSVPGFVMAQAGVFDVNTEQGSSYSALAAKIEGGGWSVIWRGQDCIPKDIVAQYGVPTDAGFAICK